MERERKRIILFKVLIFLSSFLFFFSFLFSSSFFFSFFKAFEYFINLNPRSAEYISLFIDDKLKKGEKRAGDEDIQLVMKQVWISFFFVIHFIDKEKRKKTKIK